ncbi:hypothetical protein Tco_0132406 [Tanacetum coccineum]
MKLCIENLTLLPANLCLIALEIGALSAAVAELSATSCPGGEAVKYKISKLLQGACPPRDVHRHIQDQAVIMYLNVPEVDKVEAGLGGSSPSSPQTVQSYQNLIGLHTLLSNHILRPIIVESSISIWLIPRPGWSSSDGLMPWVALALGAYSVHAHRQLYRFRFIGQVTNGVPALDVRPPHINGPYLGISPAFSSRIPYDDGPFESEDTDV